MIVGNGNIAKVLKDRDDLIYFASGVSDSGCIDDAKFKRERDLLLSQSPDIHLVYFSNLAVYRSETHYVLHKKGMEDLVKNTFKSYSVIRLEVIEWGRNPTTIHNVFRRKIEQGEPIMIQDTHRYVISLGEFYAALSKIKVGEKQEMNIMGKRYHIAEIYLKVKNGEL